MAKMVTRTSHKVTLYIRNHSGYIYERLLRTYSTIWYSGHQNVQTYQRPDSAAGRLPTATPPRPSCSLSYTPIRDPFSRSNQKKKVFDDPSKICTGIGLSKWKESNGTFAVRNKSYVVIRSTVVVVVFINRRSTECHGAGNAMRDFQAPPARPDISCLPYK